MLWVRVVNQWTFAHSADQKSSNPKSWIPARWIYQQQKQKRVYAAAGSAMYRPAIYGF